MADVNEKYVFIFFVRLCRRFVAGFGDCRLRCQCVCLPGFILPLDLRRQL